MLTKVFLIVVFGFASLQELNARPQEIPDDPSAIQEAIQKINPTLDKIALRLNELKLEIYKTILKASTERHGLISKFSARFLKTVEDFQSHLQQTSEEASKSTVGIERCLCSQRENLQRILMVATNKIKKISKESELQVNNFTERASNLQKEVDDIEKNMNKLIGYCIRQNSLPWQKEKLAACLVREAQDLDKVVDNLYQQKDLINSGEFSLENNITTNQNNLLEWTTSLREEFSKCVAESQDLKRSDKSKILETTSAENSEEGEITQTNFNLQLNSTEISKRIQRLEFLLNQLNQTRLKNSATPESVNLQNSKEAQSPKQENRRFILYISL